MPQFIPYIASTVSGRTTRSTRSNRSARSGRGNAPPACPSSERPEQVSLGSPTLMISAVRLRDSIQAASSATQRPSCVMLSPSTAIRRARSRDARGESGAGSAPPAASCRQATSAIETTQRLLSPAAVLISVARHPQRGAAERQLKAIMVRSSGEE